MTTTRGPRRRLSEDERRGQIITATIVVVAERGYGAASLSAVAERAGVSKGLVSHYFTDRDTLMLHTARAALVEVRTAVAADIDLGAPVPEVFRAAIHRAARLGTTHGSQLTAIEQIVTNLRNPAGDLVLSAEEYEETYRGQEALLLRGQREGTLRAFDVSIMAITYQSAVDAMIGHLTRHPEADPDAYADRLADLLVAAIRA